VFFISQLFQAVQAVQSVQLSQLSPNHQLPAAHQFHQLLVIVHQKVLFKDTNNIHQPHHQQPHQPHQPHNQPHQPHHQPEPQFQPFHQFDTIFPVQLKSYV